MDINPFSLQGENTMINLAQTFFLLAIDDDDGKLVPTTSLRYGLIGAVLIELALLGKVGLDEVEAPLRARKAVQVLINL
jgi:hypothetical protein